MNRLITYPILFATTMKLVTDNVESMPESGPWVAEEPPGNLLALLTPFLTPYRDSRQADHLKGSAVQKGSSRIGE